MALTYDQDSRLRALSPVLDEYGEWEGRVLRQIFYPGSAQPQELLALPHSFKEWIAAAGRDDIIPKETLDRLSRLHDDLGIVAKHLVEGVTVSKENPDLKAFDTFITLYDEFVAHIRRLERDLALTDSGFDFMTGLRSRQTVTKDLEREMERRARRGRPFCVALARIDHHTEIKANLPQQDYETLIKAVAEIIRQCMRSFDDAYYMENGEFVMCLKQADITGGTAGLGRLRKLLNEQAPYFVPNGKERRLSVSSCVAEPEPGDRFEDMMVNMRNDLNRYGGDSGTSLEYIEVSPLKRYVLDIDDQSKKSH